jgi:cold-inducible RNA-binding protein
MSQITWNNKPTLLCNLRLNWRIVAASLILLSRIDGDAPRAASISAGRLDSSRAGLIQLLKPLTRASEPGPSNANRFAEANPIRSFFHSHRGKVYLSMSTKLYVGNLAFQTTSQQLQDLFAQAGTVQSASIIEDRETGRSRGFAFVEMSSNAEAAAAIDQFNGKDLGGRALKVNEAKPRENRSGGGRNFDSNRGGSRGGNGNSGGGYREPRW